jgi:hypothetical protein
MKKNKNSIEYKLNKLFNKETFTGFRFVTGNTPLGIKEKRDFRLSSYIDINRSHVVIDESVYSLEKSIMLEIFKEDNIIISKKQLLNLQKIFKELNYKVEESKSAGYWYWFIVKCEIKEIRTHIEILKQKIKNEM